jgi:CO/xanthine dehydrogenase Mo-binding subunit
MRPPQLPLDVDPATGVWRADGSPVILVPRHFLMGTYKAFEEALGAEGFLGLTVPVAFGGMGQGFSVMLRSNAYWACAVHVSVVPDTGKVRVLDVTTATVLTGPVRASRARPGSGCPDRLA